MDYIFRWLQLRFLTGQQQALFDGLRPKYVNAPPPGTPDENGYGQKSFGDVAAGGRRSPVLVCHPDVRRITHLVCHPERAQRAEGPAFAGGGMTPPSTPPTP